MALLSAVHPTDSSSQLRRSYSRDSRLGAVKQIASPEKTGQDT